MTDKTARFYWARDAFYWARDAYQAMPSGGSSPYLAGWVGILHPEDAQSGDPDARWYAHACTAGAKWIRNEFHSREDAMGFVQLIVSGYPE